ncbi:hypothetical protein [Brevibacillus sp. H7]|jgi:uncharacterized membrane protein (DUF485 family)|uniref:hypothetical protein n=1 Tax=Brevibacillus sp. H7 TaxID=3349138 RepID=UPI0038127C38
MSSPNLAANEARKRQSTEASAATQFVTQEELEQVERSFRAQRKLSFTFGFYFFLVTLLIPFLSGTSEWWYGKPFLFGLTLNFWSTLLLFHVFYWILAYVFVKKANRMDDEIKNL